MIRTPFSRMAGLKLFAAVCPLVTGSVSVIRHRTFCGSATDKASSP